MTSLNKGVENPNEPRADTRTLAAFFSIPDTASKLAKYRATWSCGSTWDFDRHDLSVPVFYNGEQSGVSIETDTLREMLNELRSEGAKVERL